jgi:hypothetical protein
MVDSNGNLPSGLLSGTTASFGSIQECLTVKREVNQQENSKSFSSEVESDKVDSLKKEREEGGGNSFQGQYCLLSFLPSKRQDDDDGNDDVDSSADGSARLEESLPFSRRTRETHTASRGQSNSQEKREPRAVVISSESPTTQSTTTAASRESGPSRTLLTPDIHRHTKHDKLHVNRTSSILSFGNNEVIDCFSFDHFCVSSFLHSRLNDKN